MIERLNKSDNYADFVGKLTLKDIKSLPKGTRIASNVGLAKPMIVDELKEDNAKNIFDEAKRLRITGTKLYGSKTLESLSAHLSQRQKLVEQAMKRG